MTWLDLFWLVPLSVFLVAGCILAWGDEPSFLATLRSERRADTLLRGIATPEQYRQWRREQHIDIPSTHIAGITYRYMPGRMIGIYEAGGHVADLCIQTPEQVPSADLAAAHLLAIRACEADWLATGNLFYPRTLGPSIPYALFATSPPMQAIFALRSEGQTMDRHRRTAHATQPLTEVTIGRMREMDEVFRMHIAQHLREELTGGRIGGSRFGISPGERLLAEERERRQQEPSPPDPSEEPDPPAANQRYTVWLSLLACGIFIVPITAWAIFCATHMALVASWFG